MSRNLSSAVCSYDYFFKWVLEAKNGSKYSEIKIEKDDHGILNLAD